MQRLLKTSLWPGPSALFFAKRETSSRWSKERLEFHRPLVQGHEEFNVASQALGGRMQALRASAHSLRFHAKNGHSILYRLLDDDGLDASVVEGFEIFL